MTTLAYNLKWPTLIDIFAILYCCIDVGISIFRYTFLGYNEMMQFASFAGLGGLNFVLSWGGTVGSYVIQSWKSTNSGSDSDVKSNSDDPTLDKGGVTLEIPENDVNSPQQSRNFRNIMTTQLTNPITIYLIAIFFIIVYGSIRYSTTFIPFYQQNIESYAAHSLVKVGCVIGSNNDVENKYYVDRTEELARNGSKFILWSEEVAIVNSTAQYNDLELSIKNISQIYKTYIGFTYYDASSTSGIAYNKLTVVSPDGDILINYAKANLVPLLETGLAAGPKILQTSTTSDFGTIGGAICFDYDFPNVVNQASNNVDFMIQPSDTWGNYFCPTAAHHFRVNSIKSIELGFTLFRCCHYGFSGVWGPYGQPYVAVETVEDLILSFDIPLHKRVKTVYGIFGESWAWICLAFSILICIIMLALTFLPAHMDHLRKPIKRLFP
ncbi:22175_t:CDS:2 [Cetraspora pellucida]|uniref:22175_t:CDS:1 n=1 Tax=Cetraspora pellucida TaxID=1433469 RepID=A0A9N9BWI4_9GLOM|nr:22175_t:CDS:2 [Cetraspora pellucida]